jgi:tetratricopeptide (TPR) repeat protein
MKRLFFLMLASAIMTTAFAQSEKYMKAMEAKVAMLDSNNTADSWKEMANTFERIGDAEKTQWLPYYYAAYCQVMAGNFSMPQDGSFGDNSALLDPYADKAESLLNKAVSLGKENSETFCLKKMVYGLRMMGNPMTRFMTDGAKANEALQKAKDVNPDNPRVYILEAQDKFFTPEQFGGSKAEAKVLFEKANELLGKEKPASSIDPHWGKSTVAYFLSQMK